NANTLDYIPSETQPYPLNERKVTLSGKQFTIFTDFNDSEKTKPSGKQACKHLNEEGRCGIHMKHPFSCDFELLRFNNPKDRDDPTKWVYLNHRLFGR